MIVATAACATQLWIDVCRQVVVRGALVRPRGMATVEALDAHLCLTDPRRRLVHLPGVRVLNPAFAVAEALWILSGSDDPWIFTYNHALTRYADDGRLRGAYGPRMRAWHAAVDQLARVRDLLAADPDSRQAVIQLYDPGLDTAGNRDVPCTLNYRFFIRGGRLLMHTTMRSNDVWLGLPYDVFTATVLQEILAGWLGVELGPYHHHVDSLHLYEQHVDGAGVAAKAAIWQGQPMPALRAPAEDFTGFLGTVLSGTVPVSAGEEWQRWAAVLASYRCWSGGDRAAAREAAAGIEGRLGQALRDWYRHLDALTVVTTGTGGTQ